NAGVCDIELATPHRGAMTCFLEHVRTEPLHGPLEVLGADMEHGRVGVVDVSVDRPVHHPVRLTVLGVLLMGGGPTIVIVHLAADEQVLHHRSPSVRLYRSN